MLHVLADAPTNEAAQWLAVYQGPPFPELLLFQAQQAPRTGGNAFPFALACLVAFPTARFEHVRAAVDLARADPYHQLAAEAGQLWSLDEDTAVAVSSSAATNFTSLRDAYAAIAAHDTLLARLDDPADALDDLGPSQPALRFPGLARALYPRSGD